MKAMRIDQNYFRITDGEKWWSASALTSGWLIVNRVGRVIKQRGDLGRRIIAAIEEVS